MSERFAVVLVAAGKGARMGASVPKQYLKVGGCTILEHTLLALARCPRIAWVQPVFAPDDALGPKALARRDWPFAVLPPAQGGKTRAHSVAAGIRALPSEVAWVAVHDAVRPCVSEALLDRVLEAAVRHGAAVPGIPVVDTIKELREDGFVHRTLARERLVAVQTPQAARRDWFEQAIARLGDRIADCTDDAAMLERAGFAVFVCEGERDNRKITTPEDLQWLQERIFASGKDSTRTASPKGAS